MEGIGLLAPFHNQMTLGQGFNSFSQEVCLVDAVDITNEERPGRIRASSQSRSRSRASSHNGRPIIPLAADGQNQVLAPKKAHDRQKVTFETKMVSSKADVDHSLGVSSYASLTAGNQGGKASAFVDSEGESHDGDLHYHVKVVVTNESHIQQQQMHFIEHDQFTDKLKKLSFTDKDVTKPGTNKAASEFTKVYGDRFISGFVEGGSLSAIISIKLHDKKDSKKVRTEASAKLALGQTPFSGEAGGSVNSSNSSAFSDHEVLVNVRWVGGGQTPGFEKNWDLDKLIRVANAFPNMVAQSSNKLFAVLTPYSALGSFLDWQMKHQLEGCVLDYTKCEEYMALLLEDFNSLEGVNAEINKIMKNRSYYRRRKPVKNTITATTSTLPDESAIKDHSEVQVEEVAPVRRRHHRKAHSAGSISQIPALAQTTPTPIDARTTSVDPFADANRMSILSTSTEVNYPRRSSESDIAIEFAEEKFNDATRYSLDPIDPDLPGLDKARWLCCQARMSIKEQAETLVLHPEAAVLAQQPDGVRIMRTPDYLRPLVLKDCLPEYHGPETGEADAIVPNYVVRDPGYYVAPIVGDRPTRHRCYTVRFSDEPPALEAPHELNVRVAAFAPSWWQLGGGRFARECRGAVGAVDVNFSTKASRGFGLLKRSASRRGGQTAAKGAMEVDEEGVKTGKAADISKVVVWHREGSGFVQGLEFFDKHGSCVVGWRQWGSGAMAVPEGVVDTKLTAPNDGSEWRFAGLGTEWDQMGLFGGQVLSRVAAVWKKI